MHASHPIANSDSIREDNLFTYMNWDLIRTYLHPNQHYFGEIFTLKPVYTSRKSNKWYNDEKIEKAGEGVARFAKFPTTFQGGQQ